VLQKVVKGSALTLARSQSPGMAFRSLAQAAAAPPASLLKSSPLLHRQPLRFLSLNNNINKNNLSHRPFSSTTARLFASSQIMPSKVYFDVAWTGPLIEADASGATVKKDTSTAGKIFRSFEFCPFTDFGG
jgi:hypothetical protein